MSSFDDSIGRFEGILNDLGTNGILSIGLASSNVRVKVLEDCLFIHGDLKKAAFSAYMCCSGISAEFIGMVPDVVAVGMLIYHSRAVDSSCHIAEIDWTADHMVTIDVADIDEKDPGTFEKVIAEEGDYYVTYPEGFIDTMAGLNSANIQRGLNLLIGTKVNWWQMNHHVGQGSFDGYIAKVVRGLYGEDAVRDDSVFNIVWLIGHWASTSIILRAMGNESVDHDDSVSEYKWPEPAEDVRLRINGYPAGTAKVGVCVAVVRRILNGIYASVLPSIPELLQLLETAHAVKGNPARFHVGARILKADGEREVAEVPEELIMYCSAYVHAAMRGSTLSRSKVLMKEEEVKEHEVYASIKNIQTAMARQGVDNDAALYLMGKAGAGISSALAIGDVNAGLVKEMLSMEVRDINQRVARAEKAMEDYKAIED